MNKEWLNKYFSLYKEPLFDKTAFNRALSKKIPLAAIERYL